MLGDFPGRGGAVPGHLLLPYACVFVSQWLFRPVQREKVLADLLYPYLLLQPLYLLFDCYVLRDGAGGFQLQYTKPYWILWYQLVLLFCYLLLPLLRRRGGRMVLLAAVVCLVLSLLAGYDSSVGYYLSLSRFFTFLPYFVLGYWAGQYREKIDGFARERSGRKAAVCLLLTVGALTAAGYICGNRRIPTGVLYGSFSYQAGGYGIGVKLALVLVALTWIAFLLLVGPGLLRRRIPVITTVGRNTLPIFLLHAFVVRLAEETELLAALFRRQQPLIFLAAFLLLVLLGNPAVAKAVRLLLTGRWLERLGEHLAKPAADRR